MFRLMIFFAMSVALPVSAANLHPTIVAVEGGTAPDTPANTTYSSVTFYFHLLDTGVVNFESHLTGPSIDLTTDDAIFSGMPGAADLVLEGGTATPVMTGSATFDTENSSVSWTNDGSGIIAFSASQVGLSSSTKTALWSGQRGTFDILARRGDTAPGTASGVNFDTSLTIGPGSGSYAAIKANLTGTGVTSANNVGIWGGTPGNLTLIARHGSIVPGGTRVFGTLGVPNVYEGSRVIFPEVVSSDSPSYTALWSYTPTDSLHALVKLGDAVPGFTNGSLTTLNAYATNASGSVAFSGAANGSDPGFDSPNAIWTVGSPQPTLVVRQGDSAPGTGTSSFFQKVTSPKINQSGEVLFFATLQSAATTPPNGIWLNDHGQNQLVVLNGSSVPGVSGKHFDVLYDAELNDLGIVAFTGTYANGISDDFGIWVQLPGGQPQLVVHDGDKIDVGGGVLKTIQTLGAGIALNNQNQIAFNAYFASGAGLFVITVPEPAETVLLGLAAFASLLCRTKRR